MNINTAIPFGFMARRSATEPEEEPSSSRTKPSVAYGALLKETRERAQLTQADLAKMAGINKLTVMRVELGYEERSLKAAINMREAFAKLGLDLPPVATGDDAPSVPVTPSSPRPALSAEAERIRWNIVRFREALDLDPPGAAYVCKIPLREWTRIEDGESEPSGGELARIAKVFGCTIDDIVNLDEDAPTPKLKLTDEDDRSARYHRQVGLLTEDEQEELARLHAVMRARAAAAHAAGVSKKPKTAKKR